MPGRGSATSSSCVDPITEASVAALAPALELLDRG